MAERQGFEPWVPCGTHAFQACALSHSAISPSLKRAESSPGVGRFQRFSASNSKTVLGVRQKGLFIFDPAEI